MFNFFESIVRFISIFINFIVGLVENFVAVITTIVKAAAAVAMAAVYLPDLLSGIATVIVAYCIVINILNKGG